MRGVMWCVTAGLVLTLAGCGSGSATKSSKELTDAQEETQKQADTDERQHAKEGRKK